MRSQVRSQARQPECVKHTLLNFKQIRIVDYANVVVSLSGRIFAVERQMQPAKRHCVEHVSFHPVESSVVGSGKGGGYVKLKVVRTDWVWRCRAQRNNGTETISSAQARRHDNSRATFDHFWRHEPVEVANDNGSLLWVELNSHELF